jgi:hypothetical protein
MNYYTKGTVYEKGPITQGVSANGNSWGRMTLVVEVPLGKYSHNFGTHFCILTDRRNFVLALNTADMPENEVRMWYNPDEMENRQRAVFLAGTEILDLKLVSACISEN